MTLNGWDLAYICTYFRLVDQGKLFLFYSNIILMIFYLVDGILLCRILDYSIINPPPGTRII